METIISSKELREVVCLNCGVVRFSVIDFEECKKAGRLVAKPCPVCKNTGILIKQQGSRK